LIVANSGSKECNNQCNKIGRLQHGDPAVKRQQTEKKSKKKQFERKSTEFIYQEIEIYDNWSHKQHAAYHNNDKSKP
jgi:hypothetical protein